MIKDKQKLTISLLGHTWILDFDGTLVVHNGYKTGEDKFLPGAKEFLQSIPAEDYDSMCLAFYNGTYLVNEHLGA